jgi:hypothetical protein
MNESEKIRESGGKPAAFPIIGFTSGGGRGKIVQRQNCGTGSILIL